MMNGVHCHIMDTGQPQRRALASFLKSRRNRISPEQAGAHYSHGRRRAHGLRREELAALAGVSVTWYTWLEQARSIRVSRQVLASLGRALKLNSVEIAHLYRLAGETPPLDHRPCSREEIPQQYLDFLNLLDPLPAMIANQRFDVLAWNEAFCVLYPYFEDLPADDRNSLVMTFDARNRALYSDWEMHAFRTVALFREQNAEHLVQPEYVALIESLEQRSPQFRELWQSMDLRPGSPSVSQFDHPILGRFELGYVKLRLADTRAALVVHQPVHDDRLFGQLSELVKERRRISSAGDHDQPPIFHEHLIKGDPR